MRGIFGANQEIKYNFENPYISKVRNNTELAILPNDRLGYIAGNWRQYLNLDISQKLLLEIGCHNGQFLNSIAQTSKNHFVGLDITYKRVFTTAKKAQQLGNTNITTVLSDARHLERIFKPGELNGVYIFFPDPWNKSRQKKHRLVNSAFIKTLFDLLPKSGFIYFKSDSLEYYQQAYIACQNVGFNTAFKSLEKINIAANTPTIFESKFALQNIITYEFYKEK